MKKGYLKIKEASEYLGVAQSTLRRWDEKGKLKAYRHPISKYRLYRKLELKRLLKSIKK